MIAATAHHPFVAHPAAAAAIVEIQVASRKARAQGVRAQLWLMGWAAALAAFVLLTWAVMLKWDGRDGGGLSTEGAMEVVLNEWAPTDKRTTAAFRLRNSATLSIESLRAATRSADSQLSAKARSWLDQIRAAANSDR